MLREAFVARLAAPVGGVEDLEDELARLVDEAQTANPGIAVDPVRFVAHVAERVAAEPDPVAAVHQLRLDQLYLALACADGQAAALAMLEREHFHHVDAAVAQLRLDQHVRDEVKQRLRVRLLTPADRATAQILQYRGRGDIGRWLRAVALRAGIDELRSRARELPLPDDALAERALPAEHPELAHMKQRYRADFRAALSSALAQLDEQARTDLRLYYLEGLKLEELAALHRVAPSTISRRIARARQTVLEETRRIMREHLGLGDSDLDSILGLIASRLELSEGALNDGGR
jgi:RNA polymerase sigma-70 factor, ECF subfamily